MRSPKQTYTHAGKTRNNTLRHNQPGYYIVIIGVNSTAFGRKLTLFSTIPLSRFSLKMSRFLAYFELEKIHSMRSFQRQVELRRLDNQLPVLDKANSLFKLVQCCVFCLFVKLRLSSHCVGPGIKISRVIVDRAKSMYCPDLQAIYSVRHLTVVKTY